MAPENWRSCRCAGGGDEEALVVLGSRDVRQTDKLAQDQYSLAVRRLRVVPGCQQAALAVEGRYCYRPSEVLEEEEAAAVGSWGQPSSVSSVNRWALHC